MGKARKPQVLLLLALVALVSAARAQSPAPRPEPYAPSPFAVNPQGGPVQPASYQTPSQAMSQSPLPGAPPADGRAVRPTVPSLPELPPLSKHSAASRAKDPAARGGESSRMGVPSLATVLGSLAIVLGLFLLFAWTMRKASGPAGAALPKEVFEVLGRAPLASRQQVHLLRCGNKLLLVSSSAAGIETLTEVTDPAEVDRLAGLCQQSRPDSATTAFRQVFQQFIPPRPTARSVKAAEHDAFEPRLTPRSEGA